MARRRYLSTKISTDAKVKQLATQAGDFAVLLYTWMIPHAEDTASLTGDPDELKMMVVPGFEHKSVQDVVDALEWMHTLGLIDWRRGAVIYMDQACWRENTGSSDLSVARELWNAVRRHVAPVVFLRDGYRCMECRASRNLTVDHITPLAAGGTNELVNLQTLCRSCNSRKGARA